MKILVTGGAGFIDSNVQGMQYKLYLGNLNDQKDSVHAKDYVEVMWLILLQEKQKTM